MDFNPLFSFTVEPDKLMHFEFGKVISADAAIKLF